MTTKKIILLLVAMLYAMPHNAQTENAIQVIPFQTKAGATVDDALCFQIAMTNTEPVWGVQFRLKLPEGLTLDEYPFEQVSERCPSKRGQYFHSVNYNYNDGWYTVVLQTTTNTFLNGNSGALLNVYYLTDENMTPGIYPIQIEEALLVFSSDGNYPKASTSYVVVGESSPLKTEKHVDLSCLTGHIPSFVMEAANTELAKNTDCLSIDMTGMDSYGAAPSMPRGNTLLYVDADKQAAIDLEANLTPNVVLKSASGYSCSRLTLDENAAFGVQHRVEVTTASLKRSNIPTPWSTMCFPFELTPEQLENVYGQGACAYKLEKVEAPYICFTPMTEATTAHVPYLLYCNEASTGSDHLFFGNITLEPGEVAEIQETDGVKFFGTYAGTQSATNMYGITPESRLMRGGSGAQTCSFRALFDLSLLPEAAQYTIRHDGVTSLTAAPAINRNANLYDINGRCIRSGVSDNEVLDGLPQGVYIINHQKVIIK